MRPPGIVDEGCPLILTSGSAVQLKAVAQEYSEIFSNFARGLYVDEDGNWVSKIVMSGNPDIQKNLEMMLWSNRDQFLGAFNNVVLALGSGQLFLPSLSEFHQKTILSDDLLKQKRLIDQDTKEIVVIGGSHSAFSAVDFIINEHTHVTQITVITKDPIKIYFESKEAAQAAGYDYDESDVCTETGRINRFTGIRGSAKSVALNAIKGTQQGVTIIHGDASNCEDVLHSADNIIQACGYRPRKILVEHATAGKLEFLQNGAGEYITSADGRLLMKDGGRCSFNLHRIGLGAGELAPDVSGRVYPHFAYYGVGVARKLVETLSQQAA